MLRCQSNTSCTKTSKLDDNVTDNKFVPKLQELTVYGKKHHYYPFSEVLIKYLS